MWEQTDISSEERKLVRIDLHVNPDLQGSVESYLRYLVGLNNSY